MGAVAEVDGRVANRITGVFYAVVAVIALAGQATAAVRWLGWPLLLAVVAVGAVELGGIALSAYADFRRRLGEPAYAARLLSASVAGFAVLVNWLGHADRLQGGFFAGMSALGYAVWLIHAGARRRDQLRADGKLPDTPPVYGVWQWCRQPGLTRRARALALANSAVRRAEIDGKPAGTAPATPALGLHASLDAARAAVRTERRRAAIATVLRRKLQANTDAVTAEIAVSVYDLDQIAARLAAGADYDGLTALIAADLAPARLAGAPPLAGAGTRRAGTPQTTPAQRPVHRPDDMPSDRPPATPRRPPAGRTPRADSNAAKVAKLRAKHPDITQAEVKRRTGISIRTLSRLWPDTAPATDNGGPVPAAALTAATDAAVTTVTAEPN